MKKDDIIQQNWVSYLKWWKHHIHSDDNPPTEDDFWAWYCMHRDEPKAEL